jgi:hypothetical protein
VTVQPPAQIDYDMAATIAKFIEDYAEEFNTPFNDILLTIEYIYACLERFADQTKPHKMH